MSRRAEYAQATRAALIAAAQELFTSQGYAATSIEDVVQQARVTRGALYHHFTGKADLFLAVFEELEAEIGTKVKSAAAGQDPWGMLTVGTAAFLDACLDPPVQQIVLIEAPSVLGWERWRAIEAEHGLGLTRDALKGAMDAGYIEQQPLEPLAHMLLAALNECALYIARAEDRTEARKEVGKTLRRVLTDIRAPDNT